MAVNPTLINAIQGYGEQRNICFMTAAICLVTGTAFPEAFHIYPSPLVMGSCRLLEDPDVLYNHLGQQLGSSDKD